MPGGRCAERGPRYNSAWKPAGVRGGADSSREENCVFNTERIDQIEIIDGDGRGMGPEFWPQQSQQAVLRRQMTVPDRISQIGRVAGFVWVWKDDREWCPYPGDEAARIERAYENHENRVDISRTHTVDFYRMVQMRRDDPSRTRQIERRQDPSWAGAAGIYGQVPGPPPARSPPARRPQPAGALLALPAVAPHAPPPGPSFWDLHGHALQVGALKLGAVVCFCVCLFLLINHFDDGSQGWWRQFWATHPVSKWMTMGFTSPIEVAADFIDEMSRNGNDPDRFTHSMGGWFLLLMAFTTFCVWVTLFKSCNECECAGTGDDWAAACCMLLIPSLFGGYWAAVYIVLILMGLFYIVLWLLFLMDWAIACFVWAFELLVMTFIGGLMYFGHLIV
jgi:hypothetical protein